MRVNITLPEHLAKPAKEYCKQEGYTLSGLIQKLLTTHLTPKVLDPLPVGVIANTFKKNDVERLRPLKKKLDKNGYCPHFVKGDGYCRRCNEE